MASRIVMSSGAMLKNVNVRWRSVCIASLALCFIFMLPLLFVVPVDLFHMGGAQTAGEVADDIFGIGPRPDGGGDGSDGNGGGDGSDAGDMNRVGTACSKNDITIFQGETSPLPNGIPAYTVQILNMCVSAGCSISDIHINCGWFSSARFVNPRVFRRMDYNDCLVNDGQPLGPGQTLSFQYANTFPYPLSVSSVAC